MPKKNERQVAIQIRRYKALEMKLAGGTERSIAQVLGVSNVQIHKDIRYILGELNDKYSQKADELRTLLMARYEKLLSAHWPNAMNGDPRATDLCLQILQGQRAISGVDAPTRVTGEDGGSIRISIDELAKQQYLNGSNPVLESSSSQ
jgi:hypothetical protein